MTGAFKYTTGRWYNKPTDDGLSFAKAPAYRQGFEYEDYAYGSDYPEDFTPAGAPLQVSLLCSRSTCLLAVDVDYAGALPDSATGQHVSWANAVSSRGSHFHVLVDMRGVPDEDWPVQGRTAWGDVKAAGFVPVPGSVHYTGEPYAPAPDWPAKIVTATPDLLKALRADREEHALHRLAAARQAAGSHLGTRLPDGSYVYSSGYCGGTWAELPDGSLEHDDELKDLCWDMGVEYGRGEPEVLEQWRRLAGAIASPWTDRDFARHWHRVPARRLERLEQDDATRLEEDFGLRVLPLPLAAEHDRQQQAWEASAGDAVRPPAPPADWGFEVPGVNYFALWLGSSVFDAGRPTDADNALAVLSRAHCVLRYDEETATWLLRGTGKWDSFPGADAPRSVVAGLRALMPEGCADPVKAMDFDPDTQGGEIAALKVQARNRDRFSTSASVGAVARSMTDYVLHHRGAGSTTRASALDTEPETLWGGGVPWDLRATEWHPDPDTGEVTCDRVVPAVTDRSTPHLMTAPCWPDPSVPTPLWNEFCAAVWPDPRGREWALTVLSAAFTGYADAVMPVLLGDGGLGKTFLVNLLNSVLGDYGGVMHSDLLKPDARLHGAYTIKLKGMRLAFVDEAPGKGQASQEHLKKITGGGEMEGNRMRENPVTFTPTHTLVLAANFERMPPMHEDALRRRVRLIKFDGTPAAVKAAANAVGNSPRSPQWQAEIPGVLAAMTARAGAWLADRGRADNDKAPMTWQTWTEAVVAEQDPLLPWLTSGEVTWDEYGTRTGALHEHYVNWRKRHGETGEPLNMTRFGTMLTRLGYQVIERRDANYRPLRIVAPGVSDFMAGSGPRGQAANPPPTVHQPSTQGGEPSYPPHPPQTVHGSSASSSSDFSSVVDGCGGLDSTTTNKKKNTLKKSVTGQSQGENGGSASTPSAKQGQNTVWPAETSVGGMPSTTLHRGEAPEVIHSPVENRPGGRTDTTGGAETGENEKKAENRNSPPKAKNPKNRLTDEEKLERAAARKAKLAAGRLEAKKARIAELGGPLVQLPAVVLRDGTVMPVTAGEARAWLEPALGELSVDVEHRGYPIGHPEYGLRLVQLGSEASAVVLDPNDAAQAEIVSWALSGARVLHAHSAHADLVPLEHAGLADATVWDRMVDTVILAKLTDPSLTDSDEAALKPLARALLGDDYALSWKADEVRKAIFREGGWLENPEFLTEPDRSGWAMIPVCEAFVRYAASDVCDCAAVSRVLS